MMEVRRINFKQVLINIFEDMASKEKVFSNEAQLQYELALALKNLDFVSKVELEVLSSNLDYEKFKTKTKDDDKYYTDIVVKTSDGEYIAIELKFKTPEYKGVNVKEHKTKSNKLFYTFSQGAEDVGSYLFWKDVERLEKFRDVKNPLLLNFDKNKKVTSKFAIIMTNAPKYWNYKDVSESLSGNFFPVQGKEFKSDLCYKVKVKKLSNGNEIRVSGKTSAKESSIRVVDATFDKYKSYEVCYDLNGENPKIKPVVPVRLRGRYYCDWCTYITLDDGEDFKYMILEVE